MSEDSNGTSEDELIGGLKNALSRGETLDAARATFINAGYSPNLVNFAARKVAGSGGSPTVQEVTPKGISIPPSNLNLHAQQSGVAANTGSSSKPPSHHRVPYWAIVLMLLISLGIIIGAGVLGLYWHKLFPS